ncbi:hypothetical protein Gogos_014068 [Gossypium gossypioides]|uniref:Uncharacterized protein n=1 Tax=Gossypium gossypioides TaxID=34282 RepID=A0A7J9BXI1_GOSGO|nr:hypothetical protein [Gossypium gossypioides]
MATLSIGIASSAPAAPTFFSTKTKRTHFKLNISCVQWVKNLNFLLLLLLWKDPEGILGKPGTGHLARLEFKRRLERDAEAREAFEQHLREEKERRQALRQSRELPDTAEETIEYFLDTEAQEIEFEIARLRHRLDKDFFSHLKFEIGQIRFAVSKTEDMEDRLIELEALQKALQEGTGQLSFCIVMQLLEMVEGNELNRSLLTLLDENIANASMDNQKQAAAFMEKIRAAVLKYLTV